MKKLIYLFLWVILWSGCQRENHQHMEQMEEDSLNIPVLSPTSTKQDSLNWYGYQVYHKRSRTYAHLAQIYQEKQMNDSAIHYYFLALQKDTTRSAYFYCGRVLGLLHSLKKYDLAKQYIQGLRKQMKRSDIPYINLIEGDLWMELHQPDSAMKHYLIASETGNDFITSVAYERLALLMEEKRTLDAALDKHIQSIDVKNNLKYDYAYEHDTRDFEALKLKNELNELKVKQQSYVILILGLGAFILILCGSFTIYLLHRKRKHLMQENLLLKQQEELSTLREKEAVLREKDARMREELFRRIRIVKDLEEGNRVHIADEDWKDIHVMLESTYPGFLANLRENFPALSEKELNFCCLVKMSMSLQQLADIYCISINSVSRRKLRLKEKLGIGKEDSLSKFLNRFV